MIWMTHKLLSIAITLIAAGGVVADEVVVVSGVVAPSAVSPTQPICLYLKESPRVAGYFEMHFRVPRGIDANPYFPKTSRGRADRAVFESDRYLKFRCNVAPVGDSSLAITPSMRRTADRAVLLARSVCWALEKGEPLGFELSRPNAVEAIVIFITP